jgi:peptidase E
MILKHSVLFSSTKIGNKCIKHRLKPLISNVDKVIIFPWAFPIELSNKQFTEEYFPRYGKRYENSVGYLREFGIMDDNILIANCYKDSKNMILDELYSSNIIVLPGGNPVMMTSKLIEFGLQEILRNDSKIIIGESAGACIQFQKYFITEENNRPRGFQELEGIGVLDVDFLIDVHTNIHTTGENQFNYDSYLNKLKSMTKEYNKNIYAISDDGAILVDRNNNTYETFGNVKRIHIDLHKSKNEPTMRL